MRRKATMRPRADQWHCTVCRKYGSVVEIEATPGGAGGIALCKPCIRVAARAVLPSEGRKP